MQAFRAETTIDEGHVLHVTGVPFQPGTAVDVIVLERDASPSFGVQVPTNKGTAGSQREWPRLAEVQYQLAGQYPDEYVVLVGARVVCHSADRQEAVREFQRIAVEDPSNRPVIVRPGSSLRRRPIVRGRSLTGKLRRAT